MDIDALAAKTPNPGPAYRALVLAGRSEAELVALGQAYASELILSSVPAFITSCKQQELTDEQRAIMLGYSDDKIHLLVHETVTLRNLSDQFDAQAAKSITAYREESRLASLQGTALRDPVERMLGDVIPEGTELRRAFETARDTSNTPAGLARNLRSLAGIITRVRAEASASNRTLYAALGISDATAQRLLTTADDVDTKGRLADGAAGTQLNQRKLDYQDGVVLVLVASIWRAFRYAHEQSPTVVLPRLGRLKRLVMKSKSGAAVDAGPDPVTPPAEGGATG